MADNNSQEFNPNGNGVMVIGGEPLAHCELCKGWKDIPRIMPLKDFVGWKTPGLPLNCFDYAWAQLKKAGYTMKSPGWGSVNKINPHIYQIYALEAVGGINTAEQAKSHAVNGILYLKNAILNSIPVIVGVDDSDGAANRDKITDHFVVIVGMGIDEKGNYFLFDDNATSDKDIGPSNLNRLYCLCADNQASIIGAPDPNNSYFQNLNRDNYRVTQIRESRKIK